MHSLSAHKGYYTFLSEIVQCFCPVLLATAHFVNPSPTPWIRNTSQTILRWYWGVTFYSACLLQHVNCHWCKMVSMIFYTVRSLILLNPLRWWNSLLVRGKREFKRVVWDSYQRQVVGRCLKRYSCLAKGDNLKGCGKCDSLSIACPVLVSTPVTHLMGLFA